MRTKSLKFSWLNCLENFFGKSTLKVQSPVFIILLTLITNQIWGQNEIKIGSTPGYLTPSAVFEIASSNKGLLIPRMSTAEMAAISSPALGLMVFNTDLNCLHFYFSGWKSQCDPVNLGAWSLLGNATTVDGTHFLGTTNNIPLSMRVNNNQVFKFNTNSSIQRDGGGDARGTSAIDLQINRSASTQAATGNYSTIGGGNNNTASGPNSTVSGGGLNNASGNGATVAGGSGNTASNIATIVAGGQTNTASGNTATVSGGVNSVASGDYSFVGGGSGNTASGASSVVSGGTTNQASAQHATVAGGYVNKARFPFSFIGGGATDTTDANYAAVVAGYDNNSAGIASIIGAGQANRITSGSNNGILAGYRNRITNNRSGILAGQDNSILGWNSGILGGYGLTLGDNSVGFHAYTTDANTADVSGTPNIAYFGDVNLWLGNVNNAAKELRFYEPNTSTNYTGTNYTAFKAGAQAANLTYTLPLSMATAGQILSSDASGNMSWANTSATAWALLGNSGTTAGTHFVGTTDNVSLTFKTNNVRSGYLGTSATHNVFMGYNAGATISTGTTNTLLGATADVTTGTLTNATALGYGATVDASNKIRLGNTSVTLVETYGSFVTVSDRRLKTHISDNAIGLNFIKAVRPVKYELIAQAGVMYDGFIAQEIDSILQKQNIKTFSGLVKPENTEGGHYTVSYSTFVVPLVNAVKELDEKNTQLTTENEQLKAELAKMKAQNSTLKASVEKNSLDIETIKAMLDKKQ